MQRQHCSNMSFNRRNSSSSSNSNTSSSKLWPRRPSISKVSFPSIKKLTSSSSKPSISSASTSAKKDLNNSHAKALQIIDGSDRTTDTLLSQDEITILHEYQENNRRLHEIREKNLRSAAVCSTTEQELVSSSIQQYEVSNQYSYPPPHTATTVSNRGRRSHSSSTKERSRSSSRSKESRKHPSPQPRRRQRSSSSRGRRSSSRGTRQHSTYESTNISNMTLTATKRQSNNDIDDMNIVPTFEEKQSYINQLASQTATAMSTSQEYLPTRRISSCTTSTTALTITCDDHTEEEEDECSTTHSVHQMEISFPDICCPHHSYVHLKRYSTKTNKWLTLLEECPVCYKLQLPSLIQEQQEQQQRQQRQKQEQQQQQQQKEEVEEEKQAKDEKKERRRSKSRRRSSTSSQGSNRSSSSYNKIFKIEGQYVLSL